MMLILFIISLWSVKTARGQDLLSCPPGEEVKTALTICAIAHGGCSIASALVTDSEQKKFLLSEGCSALAGKITGEGYDVFDFLGAGIVKTIDSLSTSVLNDDDPDNNWKGYFGKFVTGIYKIGSFAQCVEKAEQKCSMMNATSVRYINEKIEDIARSHFLAASKCDVDKEMSFYDNLVYYEDKDLDTNHIRKIKEDMCRRYPDASYVMKNSNITVSDFTEDKRIKIVKYYVDFDVFSTKKKKRIMGTTETLIAFRTDMQTPKIIGEIHKKLK